MYVSLQINKSYWILIDNTIFFWISVTVVFNAKTVHASSVKLSMNTCMAHELTDLGIQMHIHNRSIELLPLIDKKSLVHLLVWYDHHHVSEKKEKGKYSLLWKNSRLGFIEAVHQW